MGILFTKLRLTFGINEERECLSNHLNEEEEKLIKERAEKTINRALKKVKEISSDNETLNETVWEKWEESSINSSDNETLLGTSPEKSKDTVFTQDNIQLEQIPTPEFSEKNSTALIDLENVNLSLPVTEKIDEQLISKAATDFLSPNCINKENKSKDSKISEFFEKENKKAQNFSSTPLTRSRSEKLKKLELQDEQLTEVSKNLCQLSLQESPYFLRKTPERRKSTYS
ncbi:uncharacterized protein LOC135120951 isoform X2 [Zophobas morio]|uniref:uncharacterized protein LOC135120951 isoform X2 n=1 Tax=Zophobas morio TaxID=2755281 RepID=UPI00308298B1